MFDMGWVADYPHPQDFLDVLFKTGGYYDYGGYSNPTADALLIKAGVEKDTNTSLALYRQAEQMMVNDTACIPLWFGRNYYVVQPYVNGYSVTPLGDSKLAAVSITK